MNTKKFYEPTPRYWRKWGDFALLMIPTIQAGLMAFPEISDFNNRVITFAATTILVGIKFWTNTKSTN